MTHRFLGMKFAQMFAIFLRMFQETCAGPPWPFVEVTLDRQMTKLRLRNKPQILSIYHEKVAWLLFWRYVFARCLEE